jgi:transposase
MGRTYPWRDLSYASLDVLPPNLTRAYFECNPLVDETGKLKPGYSRDKQSDCVQTVTALIVTPEGFLAVCQVLAGNTSDRAKLRAFLEKIETQYGKTRHV